MYVIYDPKHGFVSDDEDAFMDGFDFELNEFTVMFNTLEDAVFNAKKGEIILKIEHRV